MSLKKIFTKEPFDDFFDFPAIPDHNVNEPLFYTNELTANLFLSGLVQGIFAWNTPQEPILWWSPLRRCIIPCNELHISRSLHKLLRKHRYDIRFDHDVMQVVEKCATVHGESWIDERMKKAIAELATHRIVHSVEIWEGDELVGGLYGASISRIFCAESMFSTRPSTSKIALVYLTQILKILKVEIIDAQFMTDHLRTMGAIEIPRERYFEYLSDEPVFHTFNWGMFNSDESVFHEFLNIK